MPLRNHSLTHSLTHSLGTLWRGGPPGPVYCEVQKARYYATQPSIRPFAMTIALYSYAVFVTTVWRCMVEMITFNMCLEILSVACTGYLNRSWSCKWLLPMRLLSLWTRGKLNLLYCCIVCSCLNMAHYIAFCATVLVQRLYKVKPLASCIGSAVTLLLGFSKSQNCESTPSAHSPLFLSVTYHVCWNEWNLFFNFAIYWSVALKLVGAS